MTAPDFLVWKCSGCGARAIAKKKPCECASNLGYRTGPNGKLEFVRWDEPPEPPILNKATFLNCLRNLFNIDGYCLPELDKYDWPAFRNDPPKFFMRCEGAKAEAIWREVEKRQIKREAT